MALDLSLVDPSLRDRATKAFVEGDVVGLMCKMDNLNCLAFVDQNRKALQDRGIYEVALLDAYNGPRTNWHDWSLEKLEELFLYAARGRLLEAGDPLPPGDEFTLYRGVAGEEPFRKEAGLSWTPSLERAKWFATRYQNLTRQAVRVTTASREEIYAYTNERDEEDFILRTRREYRAYTHWRAK